MNWAITFSVNLTFQQHVSRPFSLQLSSCIHRILAQVVLPEAIEIVLSCTYWLCVSKRMRFLPHPYFPIAVGPLFCFPAGKTKNMELIMAVLIDCSQDSSLLASHISAACAIHELSSRRVKTLTKHVWYAEEAIIQKRQNFRQKKFLKLATEFSI